MDSELIWGRLYYHLDKRYGYKQDDDSVVDFFIPWIGGDRNCIHFPYLASVVAGLRAEDRKYRIATTMSVVSLCISVISFLLSILR